MSALPTGAIQIGNRLTFAVAHSNANVEVKFQLAINNGAMINANVGVYVVLDGSTSGLQDGFNVAGIPGIPVRQEVTTTILGMAAGTHTIDLYAMTNTTPCAMLFTGIKAIIFYA